MNRCVVLGASPINNPDELRSVIQPQDYIIAVDGGQKLAKSLNAIPDVIVADFDSSQECLFPTVQTVHLPVMKNETDMEDAIAFGVEKGYTDFLVCGGLGGRLDHEFANYLLCVRYAEKGVSVTFVDGKNRVTASNSGRVKVDALTGKKLSLFAIGNPVTHLTIDSALYPLQDYTLMPLDSLCVSNETLGDGTEITFSSGTLLIFISGD